MTEGRKELVEGDRVTPRVFLFEDTGEGCVAVTEVFQKMNSLQQADLLQDWLSKLEDMYASVTDGTFLQDLHGGKVPPTSKTTH